MALPERLKFGIFMAPFHRLGENPTLALERDLELLLSGTVGSNEWARSVRDELFAKR